MLPIKQKTKLAMFAAKGAQRQRFIIQERSTSHLVVQGRSLINFTSNDYLDLNQDLTVKQVMHEAINQYGMGSNASALISGYYEPHALLEQKLAKFFNRDRALLFNSGFLANLGLMTTFANRGVTVLADRDCHASLLNGIQLSRAKLRRYAHHDYQHLEHFLQHNEQPTCIATEGVFSMDGSLSDVKRMVDLARHYQSLLILDDAHGAGVLGTNGKGSCEVFNLQQDDVPLLVVPLGKSFAGLGAVILGDTDRIELLIQFANTYRYTTALPPHLVAGMLQALSIIEQQSWRRKKLLNNIKSFIKFAKNYDLPLMNEDLTPIKTFLIGDNQVAVDLQMQLMQQGFFVSCIRPPTVAGGTARLRISLSCAHHEHELQQLVLGMNQLLCH